MFKYFNIEKNNIGEKGCYYLAKTNWNKFQYLDLSNQKLNVAENNIKRMGCVHLVKANWPNLKILYLCRNIIMPIENNSISEYGCE